MHIDAAGCQPLEIRCLEEVNINFHPDKNDMLLQTGTWILSTYGMNNRQLLSVCKPSSGHNCSSNSGQCIRSASCRQCRHLQSTQVSSFYRMMLHLAHIHRAPIDMCSHTFGPQEACAVFCCSFKRHVPSWSPQETCIVLCWSVKTQVGSYAQANTIC